VPRGRAIDQAIRATPPFLPGLSDLGSSDMSLPSALVPSYATEFVE